MFRYPTQTIGKTGIGDGNAYPVPRPDFLPTAYVMLTHKAGFKSEKFDDKAQ
jgi:hypothetical protein